MVTILGKVKRTWGRLCQIQKDGKKSYIAVLVDFWRLRKRTRISFYEYYAYYLDDKTNGLRDSFLASRLKRLYLSVLNPRRYFILARNKYLAHCMFDAVGIKAAEVYLYYEPTLRVAKKGFACDYYSVVQILKEKQVSECVIKTTEDSHGEGVLVIKGIKFEHDGCVLEKHNGERLRLREVLGKEPLLFEALIRQTSQMMSFNESSVNTIRFMTVAKPDGSAEVIATFAKIGRKGACVDNAGSGGNIGACVDVETGVLSHVMEFNGFRNTRIIKNHPDSGAPIDGVRIDNWKQIKEVLIRCQQTFPFLKAIGWDVALTDDGPVIIEANDFWDETGQLFIGEGWTRGIEKCYQEWIKYKTN